MTGLLLAFKEVWRNRGRFILFSLVVGLLTLLVLFVAALSEGLGSGNREYLAKLDADLIAYQDTAQLNIAASRLPRSTVRAIQTMVGVANAGPVSFASSSIPIAGGDSINISLIGVQPGLPGEPPVIMGESLVRKSGDQAIIDRNIAELAGLGVGDTFQVRSVQNDEERFYILQVLGISDSQKYGIRPSIFVPCATWDNIRSQAMVDDRGELACHIIAIQLEDATQLAAMKRALLNQVRRIELVDPVTAYESTPGYSEQQSTLNTQRTFALLIGLLVIGGFFQIQTLQKVGQIGMLKAVGTPNATIAVASLVQIILVTTMGIIIGSAAAFGLSSVFPPNVPIIFTVQSGATAVGSILLIGPLSGLVSIRYALGVEPLTALGLSN